MDTVDAVVDQHVGFRVIGPLPANIRPSVIDAALMALRQRAALVASKSHFRLACRTRLQLLKTICQVTKHLLAISKATAMEPPQSLTLSVFQNSIRR